MRAAQPDEYTLLLDGNLGLLTASAPPSIRQLKSRAYGKIDQKVLGCGSLPGSGCSNATRSDRTTVLARYRRQSTERERKPKALPSNCLLDGETYGGIAELASLDDGVVFALGIPK